MKKRKYNRSKNCIDSYCSSTANKYIILVAIYSSIISQEIRNDEELGILGSFLVALGEELALASEIRIACKAEFEEDFESEESEEIEDSFDRHKRRYKKVKKRLRK